MNPRTIKPPITEPTITPANAPCDRLFLRRASVIVVPVESVGVGCVALMVDLEEDKGINGAENDDCATTTDGMPAMLSTDAREMVVSNGTAVDVVTASDLVENALML